MSKILVVDDSSFIRTIMTNILNEGGYTEIVEASTGQEAIEKYQAEKPDLVLLDIIMPDMDGMEVLQQIGSEAKICMVTAVGQEDMITKSKELGAVDYITKPFDNEKVLSTVKTLLG